MKLLLSIPILIQDYSTKFSPWLANGTLSPRYIYHRLKKYEAEKVSNQSTYWVIFELLWRDYFRLVCLKYGDKVFYPGNYTPTQHLYCLIEHLLTLHIRI